jgi:hypothetical protein
MVALSTRIDKFSLPDDNDDEDEYSDEEEGTSNRSNADLTQKLRRRNVVTTERLTFQLYSSDLDSHGVFCVFGKEVLFFNEFDSEVTFTGWDPERQISLRDFFQRKWAIQFHNQARLCS